MATKTLNLRKLIVEHHIDFNNDLKKGKRNLVKNLQNSYNKRIYQQQRKPLIVS